MQRSEGLVGLTESGIGRIWQGSLRARQHQAARKIDSLMEHSYSAWRGGKFAENADRGHQLFPSLWC